jgi:hypothetical protein
LPSPSDTDDDDSSSENSSLLPRREDEETSIGSPVTPVTPVGPTDRGAYGNLSPRAILWIVLPMLLGQSLMVLISRCTLDTS